MKAPFILIWEFFWLTHTHAHIYLYIYIFPTFWGFPFFLIFLDFFIYSYFYLFLEFIFRLVSGFFLCFKVSLSSYASSNLGDFDSSSLSTNKEMFQKICMQHQMLFLAIVTSTSILELLIAKARCWALSRPNYVCSRCVRHNVDNSKILTNFNLSEFYELVALMAPTIHTNVRSMHKAHILIEWAIKLSL